MKGDCHLAAVCDPTLVSNSYICNHYLHTHCGDILCMQSHYTHKGIFVQGEALKQIFRRVELQKLFHDLEAEVVVTEMWAFGSQPSAYSRTISGNYKNEME